MKKRSPSNDEIGFILFTEIYSKLTEPKSKRKAFYILEAAIQCFAKSGFDAVTLEMIAREAGVTRPLLRHYFADGNDLRTTALKYIRVLFQRLAVDAVKKENTVDGALEAYVDACFYWVEHFKAHSDVWLSFLYRCAKQKSFRDLNSAAARVGEERILSLIRQGAKNGILKMTSPEASAKALQSLITGALVTYVSENLKDRPAYKEIIKQECLRIAGHSRMNS